MKDIVFTDRYLATGTPYPDSSSCDECDGMGLYPCQYENINEEACKATDGTLIIVGQKDSNGKPLENDGWLIVCCPVCKGSRKATQSDSKDKQ